MLSPSGRIVAVAAGSITTALGGHIMVSYGINIPPDAALTIPAAAGLIAGHVWDVMTRQPIPDPTQGQAAPPTIPLPTNQGEDTMKNTKGFVLLPFLWALTAIGAGGLILQVFEYATKN
jgi:hypothetical protein